MQVDGTADMMDFRQQNNDLVQEILKVCLSEIRESFVGIKRHVEKLRQLLLVMQGFPCEERLVMVELSVAYNLCLLLLGQPGQEVINISTRTLERVLECLRRRAHSYDFNTNTSVDHLLCEVIDRTEDGASLNVVLLLSVVCSVTLMRQRRHCDGCDVVRKVHRKIQGKSVKPAMKEETPLLLEVPSVVRKSRHLAETSNSRSETMATDLPGYNSLVTTLIASCYVTEQYTECLKLINNFNNGGQQEAFLLLVKARVLLEQDHVNECLDVLCGVCNMTSEHDVTGQVHALVGDCFSRQNRVHSAIQQYRMALQLDFTQLRPLHQISLQYRVLQLHDQELECLNLLVKSLKWQLEEEVRSDLPPVELEPLNLVQSFMQERDSVRLPVAAYRLAKRCLELDRYDAAVEKYRDLLSILREEVTTQITQSDGVPSVVEIIHELIQALIKSEQWEEAIRVCDRCVDKHCKPSGINSNFGQIEENTTKLDDLISSCFKTEVPDDDKVKVESRATSVSNKKRARSEGSQSAESYDNVELSSLSEDVIALQYKAEALVKLERHERALGCLEKVIDCLEDAIADRPVVNPASEHVVHPPPPKRAKRAEAAESSTEPTEHPTDTADFHSGQSKLLELLSEAYLTRCQVLIDVDRATEALHWSRLAVHSKPDCMYTLRKHCGLLLRLDRLSEAVMTWLPRRGIEPKELDKFQISNLIAKKSAFATGDEVDEDDEQRLFTDMDLRLLEYLRYNHY